MFAFLVASAFAQMPLFNPSVLKISDVNIDSKISVTLDSKPSEEMYVYFRGDGINFDKCQIAFDETNYNTTQEISVAGVPIFEHTGDLDTEINVRTFLGNKNYTDSVLPVERKTHQAGSFLVWGDPHYQTLDKQKYNSQEKGFYKLLSHPDFEIEVFQDTWTDTTTVQVAAAVRYHSSIFVVDLRTDTDIEGDEVTMTQLTPNVDGVIVTKPTEDSPSHVLQFPCGSRIELEVKKGSRRNYINISGEIVAGYGRTGGLVNTVDADGKFLKADGTFVEKAKLDEFVQSWKVDETENLFNGKFTPRESTPRTGSKLCPALPLDLTPPSPPYSAPTLPVYSAPPLHYSPPITVLPVPDNFFETAVQACNSFYPPSPCDLILNTPFFIDSCVADAVISGNFFFAEASKQTFLRKCGNLADNLVDNALPADTSKGEEIIAACGFKDKECPKSCSNNGQCSSYGCVCNPGFAGIDCSVDFAPVVQLNPDTNTYTANCPPSTYSTPATVHNSAPANVAPKGKGYDETKPKDDYLSTAPKPVNGSEPIYSSAISNTATSLMGSIVLSLL